MNSISVGTSTVSNYVNLVKETSANLLTKTTLDGLEHITVYGSGTERYKVNCWVVAGGKAILETALTAMSLVTVTVGGSTVTGYISSLSFEELPSHWFKASLVLAKVT